MESGDKGSNRPKPSTEAVRILRDYIRQGDEEPSATTLPDLKEAPREDVPPVGLSEGDQAILTERERLAGVRRGEAIAAARADVLAAKQKLEAQREAQAAAAAETERKRIARANRPLPAVASPSDPGNSITMNLLARLLGKD